VTFPTKSQELGTGREGKTSALPSEYHKAQEGLSVLPSEACNYLNRGVSWEKDLLPRAQSLGFGGIGQSSGCLGSGGGKKFSICKIRVVLFLFQISTFPL